MSIKEVTHQGRKVIYVDFDGCRTKQDMIDMAHKIVDYLLNHPDKHLRIFFDYTNGFGTREYMKIVQEGREEILQTKTTISAAIGITGIKKVLLQGYNALSSSKGIKPFNKEEDAMTYLTSEE